jgi:hypothetical protein
MTSEQKIKAIQLLVECTILGIRAQAANDRARAHIADADRAIARFSPAAVAA